MGELRVRSPAAWLAAMSVPGDLVLTGSSDIASRLIQLGTDSKVSHAAIVASQTTVIEAYDYGLTPNEEDEGVFETDFTKLVGRSSRLNRVVVRRPTSRSHTTQAKVRELLFEAVHNSPPYPSAGATLTSLLLVLARPAVQRTVELGGRRLDAKVERLTDWLIQVIADGPERVHCSEIVTRVYSEANVELRFLNPVLGPYVEGLRAAKRTADGKIKVDRRHRPGMGSMGSHHPLRKARPSERPRVSKVGGGKVKIRSTWEASGGVVNSTFRSARQRIGDAEVHEPDLTDLILPADLERAEPFATIGILIRSGRTWRNVADEEGRQ